MVPPRGVRVFGAPPVVGTRAVCTRASTRVPLCPSRPWCTETAHQAEGRKVACSAGMLAGTPASMLHFHQISTLISLDHSPKNGEIHQNVVISHILVNFTTFGGGLTRFWENQA